MSIRFGFLLLILLLINACGPSGSSGPTAAELLPLCPEFSETGKPPLVHRARCGRLNVPLNPADSDGEKLQIQVLLLPAIHPAPKKDPLVLIAGGPGQSAIKLAQQLHYTFDQVRKERDLLFIDQRGTGQSHPIDCPQLKNFSQTLPAASQEEELHKALRACVAEMGDRMLFFTTPYAVEDLEAVRQQLGYSQFNLWGVSYGTRVALAYQQRYPRFVRTSVLDGVAPLSLALPWHAEADALAALEKLDEDCAAHGECRRRYGELRALAEQVADKLLEQSIVVSIEHPLTRLPYEVEVTTAVFASALRMGLYSRDLARVLPLAIHNAAQEDFELIVSLLALAESRNSFSDISMGMHYTVICNEDYPHYVKRNNEQSQVFLHAHLVEGMKKICDFWPRAELPADYLTNFSSDTPTLLLSGARDPVTPPRWAEVLMPRLSNTLHLVAPGGHHSISLEGCSSELIAHFIQLGDTRDLDGSCIARIKPMSPYLGVDKEALDALSAGSTEGEAP
jgi:pimeloyl-ACP methyl ester carboxylesterase